MKKKIIILLSVCVVIILLIFAKKYYKIFKTGNNISNKSINEIEQYILNINSYEANVLIEIESNKTKNIYKAKQQYIKQDNLYKQEILEPENIAGLTFTYNGEDLIVENTKLSLNKIYENYPALESNDLSLQEFIQDYQENEESKISENNGVIILETKLKNGNKYIAYKKLYIERESGTITKLEIQDRTQKTAIYILYNEIRINNLQKDDIIAFAIQMNTEDI